MYFSTSFIFVFTNKNTKLDDLSVHSYTYDLTQPLQSQMRTVPGSVRPAGKYVWNQGLLKGFTKNRISSKWVINIIHGFICQKSIFLSGDFAVC